MEKTLKTLRWLCLPLLLAACQQIPPIDAASSPLAMQGQAFARETCSSCHAIGRDARSPNSAAPLFPVIVNQEGVTAETLSVWLRGAHNYPREMDFYLQEAEVNALVAYLLTLRDPNYRRPPD